MRELTAKQYLDWKLYYEFEPFGPQVEDEQWAQTRYTMAMLAGGSKQRQLKVSDFKLLWDPQQRKEAEPQSAEEIRQKLMTQFGLEG